MSIKPCHIGNENLRMLCTQPYYGSNLRGIIATTTRKKDSLFPKMLLDGKFNEYLLCDLLVNHDCIIDHVTSMYQS